MASLLVCTTLSHAADRYGAWPAGCDPADVGRRIAENLLDRKGGGPATAPAAATRPAKGMGYPESCTAYGSFRFAGAIRDKGLLGRLTAKYAYIADNEAKYVKTNAKGVDSSIF